MVVVWRLYGNCTVVLKVELFAMAPPGLASLPPTTKLASAQNSNSWAPIADLAVGGYVIIVVVFIPTC
jgi:hypothetical protein